HMTENRLHCKLAARDGSAEKAGHHQKRERIDQPQPGSKSQLTCWVGSVLSIAKGGWRMAKKSANSTAKWHGASILHKLASRSTHPDLNHNTKLSELGLTIRIK
ncbi:hypothetical protein A2U01_0047964, partial [Trifolium medium]|nr:hypothetical protein [Trifolium medium]